MTDSAPDKTALRAEAERRRAAARAAHPYGGDTASALFPPALIPPPGAVVSGYHPFRSEIDPRPLMRRLARAGCRLALPVTPAAGTSEPLSFRLWSPERPCAPGRYAIPEPDVSGEAVGPDLLLVPLLAFDRRGHRLGYGAGWFDRTLAALRALKPVTAVGLAWAAQEAERVPTDPWDQPLDGIVTERAWIPARKDD
ncbi:MAG TPA: 5-formyltetrahydrofolate cyclo-ligase [Caulobacteraceae bacterium]|nr:5-formyltetrahydrofolate cyclo-ligase [Caulobacteraceae bacterium]